MLLNRANENHRHDTLTIPVEWGNNYYMPDAKQRDILTRPLRAALSRCESLSAVERATGVKRQALAKFMRGEQSLRLDMADRLASYFSLELRKRGK